MTTMINTNVMSLNSQRNLATNSASLATTIQRLSSGLRINSARDDAAGLAISERFSTQIRGMNVAVRNANDGISLAQTAEGAMGEIGNNLQRIRELAVQSRNATNSASDRAALNAEAQQLKSEISRVAGQTEFNGLKLLDGTFTSQAFQIGANSGQTITVDSIANANISQLGTWTSAGSAASSTAAAPTGAAGAAATQSSFTFSSGITAGELDFRTNVGATPASSGTYTAGSAFASADFSSEQVSFDVDGTTVTLNADYTDQDGVAAAIQGQLTGYTVAADGTGVLTITNNATGAASTAPAITNWNGDVDGVGATISDPFSGGVAVNGANSNPGSDDSATFVVDGTTVTLNQQFASVNDLVSDIQSQLGGSYTVSESSGTLSITSTAAGAAGSGGAVAVAVSGGTGTFDARFGTAGSGSSTVGADTGAATFGAGSFTLNGQTINYGAAADAATRTSDLVSAINASSAGVTASVDGSGALVLTNNDASASLTIAGADAAQTGLSDGTTGAVAGATNTGFAALDISTAQGADDAIKAMDGALDAVNSARADMGAVQNRFQSVIANLQTTSENLSASRSRIRDTDFAKETAELARTQILSQAGTAMLAQANQATQGVLSLLR